MDVVPETCTRADLPDILRLVNAVFRASGGDMGVEYPLVFAAENLAHCHVVKEGGRVVSHVGVSIRDASVLGCRLRTASVGAVCTDPAARGKGYASRLMEAARRSAVAEGASLMLISGGRGMYHRLGFVNVGSFRLLLAARARLPAPGPGLRLSACGADNVPALLRLYQSRPVRFERPLEDWERLLGARMLMDRPSECLGVWEGNALVAYAGVQVPNARGRPSLPRVLEHAGSESALFETLAAIADRYGSERIEVVVMPATHDPGRLLATVGSEEQETAFRGTVGIINPARFLDAFRPYLQERLGRADAARLEIEPLESGGARFRAAGERYNLDTMGRLTALVFGGSTPEARDVPAPSPGIAPFIERMFPVPLLWYGYNYV
ncbi:MAG: GNAT family N-acetyltransferase [Armatimonadetes bacterium]|nr:GNAT family N-acetyltransferase [Armatimonadota bacterium]